METNIRKARLEDVNSIVRIHLSAFESFFLSSLGEHFLRLYYSTFINSKNGVVFCAERDECIVGFSACSYKSRGFNSSLIKENLIKYGLEFILLLFSNPKAIIRLVKNLNKESDDTSINDNGGYAELYSIAINPTNQGEGIGKILLTTTESEVKKYNNMISLTTDFYNNEKTIGFYRSLGYKNYYDFVTYPKRRMWRLIKELKYAQQDKKD